MKEGERRREVSGGGWGGGGLTERQRKVETGWGHNSESIWKYLPKGEIKFSGRKQDGKGLK